MLAFKIFVLILQEGKHFSAPVNHILFLVSHLMITDQYLCYLIMLKFSYSAKYVKEYIEGARPIFSVGEYWDPCNYNNNGLDYNQGIIIL